MKTSVRFFVIFASASASFPPKMAEKMKGGDDISRRPVIAFDDCEVRRLPGRDVEVSDDEDDDADGNGNVVPKTIEIVEEPTASHPPRC